MDQISGDLCHSPIVKKLYDFKSVLSFSLTTSTVTKCVKMRNGQCSFNVSSKKKKMSLPTLQALCNVTDLPGCNAEIYFSRKFFEEKLQL